MIYTRQSTCTPIRAEEGLSGILCPPNSSTSFRDLPAEEQIGGYPTVEQAQAAPDASELSGDFSVLDSEGRCMILEFPGFVLIGVYNPATRDDARNAFRIGFLNLLDLRVRNLAGIGKRVVLAGDLNIVKEELDMANAEVDLRKRGTSIEEYFSMPPRRMLNQLLENGKVRGVPDESRNQPVLYDICRSFHPHRKGMFTCWETKVQARPGNYGSRIDYILCSLDMRDWFEDSNIQEGLMVSRLPCLLQLVLIYLGIRSLSSICHYQGYNSAQRRPYTYQRPNKPSRYVRTGPEATRILNKGSIDFVWEVAARVQPT